MSKNSIKDTYFSEEGKSSFYEIVTTNLFPKMELANYDSLCRVLNISKIPAFGKARLRHNSAWSCFFEFHRVEGTNRIMIDKIYPFDKIKEYECPTSNGELKEKKERTREYYLDYILPLLQDYVETQHKKYNTISFTTADILTYLGYVNNNFIKLHSSIQEMYIKRKYDSSSITLHSAIQLRCMDLLKRQLKRLQKNGYIKSISEAYFIQYKNDNMIHIADDKAIDIINKTRNKYIDAGEDHIHWNKSINNRHLNYLINKEFETDSYNFVIKGYKYIIEFTDKFSSEKLSTEKKEELRNNLNKKVYPQIINKVLQEAVWIYNESKKNENADRFYRTEYHIMGDLNTFKRMFTDRADKYILLENKNNENFTLDEYDPVIDYEIDK